jgi:hypothetical protein
MGFLSKKFFGNQRGTIPGTGAEVQGACEAPCTYRKGGGEGGVSHVAIIAQLFYFVK